MSNYRQFQIGPSAEARQDFTSIRKATKDREREAYERAEANRRDARLPDDFSWERKRREPFVIPETQTEASEQ